MIVLLLRSGVRSAVGRSYLIAYSWSQRGRTVVHTAQKSWQLAELAKVTRLSLEARSARQRRHSDFSDFLGNTDACRSICSKSKLSGGFAIVTLGEMSRSTWYILYTHMDTAHPVRCNHRLPLETCRGWKAARSRRLRWRCGMFEFATRTQRLHHSDHNHRPMWLIVPALSVIAPTYR